MGNKKKGSSQEQHQCGNENVGVNYVAETRVPGHSVTGRPAEVNWEHPRNDPVSDHHQQAQQRSICQQVIGGGYGHIGGIERWGKRLSSNKSRDEMIPRTLTRVRHWKDKQRESKQ